MGRNQSDAPQPLYRFNTFDSPRFKQVSIAGRKPVWCQVGSRVATSPGRDMIDLVP
jgi:hypothetical protein